MASLSERDCQTVSTFERFRRNSTFVSDMRYFISYATSWRLLGIISYEIFPLLLDLSERFDARIWILSAINPLENLIITRWVLTFKSTGSRCSLSTHNSMFREGLTEWSFRTFSWFSIHPDVTWFFLSHNVHAFDTLSVVDRVVENMRGEKNIKILSLFLALFNDRVSQLLYLNVRYYVAWAFSRPKYVTTSGALSSSRDEKPRSRKFIFLIRSFQLTVTHSRKKFSTR